MRAASGEPDNTLDNNKVIAQGIYGLKGGIFFGDSFELEGSFGYIFPFNSGTARILSISIPMATLDNRPFWAFCMT